MKIEIFEMERLQSLYENKVTVNLTESGIHPYSLSGLFTPAEIEELADVQLGYGQTNGDARLRETISHLYHHANPGNILITNGSSEANFIATWSLVEPGDEIIFMLPNYRQIQGLARSFRAKVKPFFLREEINWAPDLDELKRAVSRKTKIIAVCNPNNPTGALLNRGEMEYIVQLARSVDAWVYADEIYRGAEFDGDDTTSFFGNFNYHKIITSGGLSKAYGLPGLRLGWLTGPVDFIEKAWSYHDYTTISPNILGQFIAQKVLSPDMRLQVLNRCQRMLNENLDVLSQWVEKHGNLFYFIPPKAGAIAFLRYNMDIKSRDLSTRLREEKGVFVMDGECFGLDGYIRIGIGSETPYLQAGLQLIDEFLTPINP